MQSRTTTADIATMLADLARLLHATPPLPPGDVLADLLAQLQATVPAARSAHLSLACAGARRTEIVAGADSSVADESEPSGVLTVPLPGAAGVGSLAFCADAPFPPGAAQAAEDAAAVCSVAVAALGERLRAENLETALASSRQIAAAVGIAMAQHRCTYEEAFARLKSASQHAHRKMRELADDILFTGEVPTVGAVPDGASGCAAG